MLLLIGSEKTFLLVSFVLFSFPLLFWEPGISTTRKSFTENWIESGSGSGVPEASDMV